MTGKYKYSARLNVKILVLTMNK